MHADAPPVAVELLDVLQRGDQVAGHATTGIVEDLEAEELRAWSHTRHPRNAGVQLVNDFPILVPVTSYRPDRVRLRGLALAGQNAGHVGAMPEVVLEG